MSARNAVVLVLSLSTLIFLAACGNNGPTVTQGVAPPSGAFGNGNLNGTYVFSVSGTDDSGDPYAVVGTIDANGSGGISGGTLDMNDTALTSAIIAAPVNSGGSYSVGQDGRGTFTINFSGNPFDQNLTFDFVLQNSFHGLVTEFDSNATGSGTLDVQTAGVTPAGSYAFSFSGATFNGEPFATAGNFTLSGTTATGLEDFNANSEAITNSNAGYPLSGTISAEGTATTLATSSTFGTLTFDVFPIDSGDLKFIEVDSIATLVGDAFTESTTMPTGNLVFTLAGDLSSEAPFAAGGIMVTSGGDITNASSEDYNNGGNVSTVPETFTGTYGTGTAGRFSVSLSGFLPATVTTFVAYPSSGGVLLMETDGGGITSGAAYAQTAGATFAASQGYGLNLSGLNLGSSTGSASEIDDIAEFASAASGTSCTASSGTSYSSDTLTGVTDENSTSGVTAVGQALCGQYSGPDSTGRLGVVYYANTTNGGVGLTAYTVDGTTFPFIESDDGQVSSGVFVQQNASATSSSVAKTHRMFVPPAIFHAHAAKQKRQTSK